MKGYHDIGGEPAGEIPKQEHEMLLWEKRVEAMLLLLSLHNWRRKLKRWKRKRKR
jgi:hypothetical protein